jgi:hypothetical protein
LNHGPWPVTALYIRLIEHINNNNILVGQQFGIRKRLATEDAILIKLIHEILNALNKKVMVGNIFYDLEKLLILLIIHY